MLHPAYQRIMAMGPVALPWVLEELRDRPDHWFWALTFMAGEDAASGTTKVSDAVASWLHWGKERGYSW